MSTAERQRTSARRDSLLGDRPGAFASARYVRITPMKARRVVDLVRGLPVEEALAILQFSPQAADLVGDQAGLARGHAHVASLRSDHGHLRCVLLGGLGHQRSRPP